MSEPNPDKPRGGPPAPQTPNRFSRSLIGWVIVIGLALLLFTFVREGLETRQEISSTEFWAHAQAGHVKGTVIVRDKEIEGTLDREATPGLKKNEALRFYVKYDWRADKEFNDRLIKALGSSAKVKYEFTGWWEGVLPHVLFMVALLLVVWFLLFRRLGAAAGGGGFLSGFGRSRHRVLTKEHTKITFTDVAGIDEAKEEVREVIEFLKSPKKFQRLGGRVPRGVLLVGEPGCGKTLLAKAIAGEADVPFFSISGSDFVEMFVGVGASRVRDLFKQAKDSAPCIIFLDEIDAVGRRRGVGFNGGGHDEREQTLNAILVEIDGFDSSDQVIVIAATNRSDILDPALTRPGRFDRQITVPLPDLTGRCEILKIYAIKVKCGPDVDLHRLARGTPMFSGADLAALVNEAAIAATMANKEFIEQADMEEARDKVRWGRARKNRVIDEKEKEITAHHEAGHAMVQCLTPGADPLHKVSIIPRGQMGGATFSLPESDRYLYTRSYCKAEMCVLLGGRLAEEMFCNDISSGAAGDITMATELARKMVLDWGMSEKLGFIRYSGDDRRALIPDLTGKEYSERTAEIIDQEIRGIVDEARAATRAILDAHRDRLRALAAALLKYETLSGDEVRQIIEGKPLDKPTMGDLFDREQARSAKPAAAAPSPSAPPAGAGPVVQPG
jgi:cell division protease FtsH